MSITLRSPDESFALPEAFAPLVGTDDCAVAQFYDDCVYDEGKGYHTFKITTKDRAFVLKQYAEPEDLEAECRQYALLEGLPVPRLLGRAEKCVLMEFVEGDDLKIASEAGVRALAKSLAAIMNAYPMGRGYAGARYETYLKRLERRALCLADEPLLRRAFALFTSVRKRSRSRCPTAICCRSMSCSTGRARTSSTGNSAAFCPTRSIWRASLPTFERRARSARSVCRTRERRSSSISCTTRSPSSPRGRSSTAYSRRNAGIRPHILPSSSSRRAR